MSARPLRPLPAAPGIPGATIVATLGEGRSAVVYLARQEPLNRLVALKVLRRPIDDAEVLQNFQRDVKAVARLSGHPNIITIYSTGRTASGQAYVLMEYADRGSLADVLRHEGALPASDAISLGLGVADGLVAAHAVGLIHCDVKPGNVLLTSGGGVKLADFGMARLLSGTSATTTGAIAYTPEHVAPEMLEGHSAGQLADVYGLASTLVETLTGRPPFGTVDPGESVETVLTRKRTQDGVALPETVPPRLRTVLTASLTADVGHRPRLNALRLALAEAAQEATTSAAPATLEQAATAVPPGREPLTAPPPPPIAAPTSAPTTPAPATTAAPTAGMLEQIRRPARRRRALAATLVAAAVAAVLIGSLIALARRDRTSTGTTAGSAASGPTSAGPSSPATTAAPSSSPATTATRSTAAAGAATAPASNPPTTAAPRTAAPATSATPATRPAGSTVPATPTPAQRSQLADTFLRTYYAAVAAHDYQKSWSMLTPQFQATTAGGYANYTAFWDRVTGVEVRRVDVQPSSGNATWPIVANLAMRYTVGSRVVDEVDQLTLDHDSAGAPLISGYRVTGSG